MGTKQKFYLLKKEYKIGKFFCLFFLSIAIIKANAQSCTKPFHIVILGSSTAYGNGASKPSKAWAYLYADSLNNINSEYIVDNLAIPGTTTYSAQADYYVPPADRPAPISGYNITAAIKLKADAIIVNYPSNDAVQNFTLKEQKANFKRISNAAKRNNILIWIATPQPRNNLTAAQVSSQKKLLEWIEKYYQEKSIDFHTGLASAKDSILYEYNSGDGIHVNDAGHRVLYRRVLHENIPDSLCNLNNNFELYKANPIAANLKK